MYSTSEATGRCFLDRADLPDIRPLKPLRQVVGELLAEAFVQPAGHHTFLKMRIQNQARTRHRQRPVFSIIFGL